MVMPKQLLDQWGRPIDIARLAQEESGPTVTGVRQVLSGHPASGLTPVRLARLLRDAEEGDATAYLELAEEIEEKDLHYRSVLGTRKVAVAGLEITVEAASDRPEDVADADLVRSWLQRDELREELFDLLDAIGKGFSAAEIVWDTAATPWLPRRLEWRDPRWFEFDRVDGRTLLLRSEQGPQPLKPYGYITHVHKSKSGLPIRGGLSRAACWLWLFKNFDLKAWVVLAEVFGHPLRLGKYGQGASEKDKATLLAAVRNIGQDAAAIIPQSMMIEFVNAAVTGNVELHERLADWIDRQISKLVLGQTGTTDVGQHVGTAQAHEKVRQDIEAADADQLSTTLNRDLVRPLIDLNRGPRKAYPRLRIFRADPEDLDGLVERVVKLVPLGLKVERSWMADKVGVPDPDAGAELLTPPGAAPPPAADSAPPPAKATNKLAVASQRDPVAAGDETDALADQVAELAAPSIAAMVEAIRAAIEESPSLEHAVERLAGLFPGRTPGELEEVLGRAMMVAHLEGAADA